MTETQLRRRLPVGAEVRPGGGVDFRIWAPRRTNIEVVIESNAPSATLGDSKSYPLQKEPGNSGYFSAMVAEARAGTRYRFRVDREKNSYPDPASRFQPEGCHGPSEVIDPQAFAWQDASWPGVSLRKQIVYEMHVGTFAPEGTWKSAAKELPELARAGITVVEVMPVAEFAGDFGWGYDGVDLFAPTRLYGRPDDFRRFVDEAHRHGLGVMLDVVYNHFGPIGNYVGQYSTDFVSKRHHTDWGEALNFDGPNSGPVREFFVANAGYWIDEFHVDGLRLDAVHAIYDDSSDHILAAIGRRVREAAAGRKTIVVAENESQDANLIRSPENGGYGLDGVWNDDFHHAARVAMTGHAEFYYGDYRGDPQELISAVKWGYLYQGQWNERQKKYRGTPSRDIPAWQFLNFLQNHDQVANSAHGLRAGALTSPGRYRAMTALLLLAPGTPLLFQGQEFGATAPFLFFADHEVELAELVRAGRQEFLRSFRSLAGPASAAQLTDPSAVETFERSRLDLSERERNAEAYALHCDLIKLRKNDAVFSAQRGDRLEGAVLGEEAFVLRYDGEQQGDDRLILVNLDRDLHVSPAAEPLLAPPRNSKWEFLWGSEDPRYGGSGIAAFDEREWYLPGHAAIVLRSIPASDR